MAVGRFATVGSAVATALVSVIGVAVGAAAVGSPSAGAAIVVSSNFGVAGPVTAPCQTPSPKINAPAGSKVHFTTSLLGDPVSAALVAPAVEITLYPNSSRAKRLLISPANKLTSADFMVPASGSVPFEYTTGNASTGNGGLLGSVLNVLDSLLSNFRQSTKAGVAVQAKWYGQIVVGNGSNACDLQPQVPSVGVTPALPGVSLPPVTVPPITPPAVSLPKVGLPGGATGAPGVTGGSPAPSQTWQLNYQPTGPSVADRTVPKGYGVGSGAAGGDVAPGLSGAGSTAANGGWAAGGSAAGSPSMRARPAPSSSELAASSEHSAITGLPSLLIVAAMILLSAATAGYARTFLLPPSASGLQAPGRRRPPAHRS